MTSEEKKKIEEDCEMWLSISLKKKDADNFEACIYGKRVEILRGTPLLLKEISKKFEIPFDTFCEMLQALGKEK